MYTWLTLTSANSIQLGSLLFHKDLLFLNIALWKIITLQDYKLLYRYSSFWTRQQAKWHKLSSHMHAHIFAVGLLTDASVVCWHAESEQTLADFNVTLRDVIPLDIDLFPLILSASLKANVSPVLSATVPYNSWCSKIAQNEPLRVITGTVELIILVYQEHINLWKAAGWDHYCWLNCTAVALWSLPKVSVDSGL